MKSITIHGIDQPLVDMIQSRAKSEGLSVNKTVKKLLEEALGVKPRPVDTYLEQFEEFCGIWSDSDREEFEKHTESLRKIHPGDWK